MRVSGRRLPVGYPQHRHCGRVRALHIEVVERHALGRVAEPERLVAAAVVGVAGEWPDVDERVVVVALSPLAPVAEIVVGRQPQVRHLALDHLDADRSERRLVIADGEVLFERAPGQIEIFRRDDGVVQRIALEQRPIVAQQLVHGVIVEFVPKRTLSAQALRRL